ncbi:MAG: hypothetical protein EOP54_31760 [Sphingobacteriales bacterium]|nr:MAG: hypothetical protein EOP54_31760 [Sphingobacteriales bacterium]
MENNIAYGHTLAGTAGGTLLVFLQAMHTEVWHAGLMAALGATISFIVSMLLKQALRYISIILKQTFKKKHNG